MRKSMKKLLVLSLSWVLMVGGTFTSYAAYESDGSYSQGNGIASLKSAIESQREYVEVTLPSQIEELETVTLPELEEELVNARAAYELDLAENPHNIDPMLKLHLDFVESSLSQGKIDVENLKSELEIEKASLARMEEELEQRTNMAYGNNWSDGYYSPDDINNSNSSAESSQSYSLTQKFWIENNSGNYYLVGKYRSWQKLMGGSWEYDSAVTPNLDISFYEGDDCLESGLSRAESYDTETTLAWYLPDGLSSSNTYVIDINGQHFRVLMSGSSSSTRNNHTDNSSENVNNEISGQTNSSETTTNYPGYYDANLADGIPNQTYYAQESDGAWLVSLGADFSAYSMYDKSSNRQSSDCVKGWLCKDGKWYAFDSVGHQVTGWVPVGGYWYVINPGIDAESSYMLTGWQEINSHWYYFNSSGQMVADCIVDGYTIGSDGIWVQ